MAVLSEMDPETEILSIESKYITGVIQKIMLKKLFEPNSLLSVNLR